MKSPLLLIVVLLCWVQISVASSGDNRLDFRGCLERCEVSGCPILPSETAIAKSDECIHDCIIDRADEDGLHRLARTTNDSLSVRRLTEPWYLHFMHWDCSSECKYRCMVLVEEKKKSMASVAYKYEPEKYYGKWPFVRVLGVQELASVVFSVFNLLAHVYGVWRFSKLAQTIPRSSSPGSPSHYAFIGVWQLFALNGINSWICSAIFHSRDTHLTERMDYVTAIIAVGYNFLIAVIRTFNMKLEATRVMVAAPVIGFVSTHVLYMLLYDFDYGLNMKVCLVFGILQTAFWPIWAVHVNHPSKLKLFIVDFGMLAVLSLEIFDFPPLFGFFDAHSLWHLSTAPLLLLWWSFVNDDARWASGLSALEENKKPL